MKKKHEEVSKRKREANHVRTSEAAKRRKELEERAATESKETQQRMQVFWMKA